MDKLKRMIALSGLSAVVTSTSALAWTKTPVPCESGLCTDGCMPECANGCSTSCQNVCVGSLN